VHATLKQQIAMACSADPKSAPDVEMLLSLVDNCYHSFDRERSHRPTGADAGFELLARMSREVRPSMDEVLDLAGQLLETGLDRKQYCLVHRLHECAVGLQALFAQMALAAGVDGAAEPEAPVPGRLSEPPVSLDAAVVAIEGRCVLAGEALDELEASLGAGSLGRVVQLFLQDCDRRMGAVGRALADADFPRAAEEAHALKGSAATLGLQRFETAAHAFELAVTQRPAALVLISGIWEAMVGACGGAREALLRRVP